MRNKMWIVRVLALVLAFSSCEKDMTRVTDITLNAASMNLIVEEEADIVAIISPADADNQKIIWSSEDSSIVEVNNGKVRAIAPGTTNVIAKADDNPDIFAACKITVNYLANKLTIESETGPVSESEPLTLKKGGSIRLKASIQPQDAAVKKVTWVSTNKDVVTISNPEAQEVEIKAVKTGETDIMVTAAGVGIYATCHIVVIQDAQGLSIEPTAAELYEDETVQLTATVTPGDTSDPITWTSSNEEIATVSDGKVYARKVGKAEITASVGSGDNAFTATCPVTVKCRVEGVSLKNHSLNVKQGSKSQLSATVYPDRASNKAVSWSSDAPHIASVSETGMLEAKTSGTVTITVTTAEGGFKDDCVVTVISDVAGISLNKSELDLRVKETAQLTATVSPSDATNKDVTWTSSDSTVATVDDNGKVTAVAPGEAVISVTTKDGGYKDSCAVRVSSKVDEITLSEKDMTLYTPDADASKRTLTATVNSADADYTLIWKSDNEAVATVRASGKNTCEVVSVGRGSTTIHVSTQDGFVCNNTVSVTVKQPYTGITLNESQLSLDEGVAEKLTATSSPQTPDDFIVWSSDRTDIATVDNNGNVTAVKAGTAIITAASKLRPNVVKATCTVKVTSPVIPVTGVSVSPTKLALNIGDSEFIKAIIEPANATNKDVTWTTSASNIATVDDNGKITAVAPGEAVIRATTKDGGHFATCTVTVASHVIHVTEVSVSHTTLSLNTGENRTITATIKPDNATNKTVTWSSSNTSVATVSNGKVTAVAPGEAVICATTEDGGHHANCKVIVTRPVVHVTEVSVSHTTLSLNTGEDRIITATIAPADATNKEVIWTSSDPTIAKVENGRITAMSKEGTVTITAKSADNSSKSATCTVTVTRPVVHVIGVSVSPTTLPLKTGEKATITATIKPDNATNKTVTWSSSNPSVATVSNGEVTAVAPGEAVICATTEDGGHHATCTVTVTNPVVHVTEVSVSHTTLSLNTGENRTITATVEPANATNKDVIWTSSDPTIAKVENGRITAMSKEGTVTITAKSADNPSKSATCTVTVTSPVVHVSGVSVSPTELTLYKGESKTITATITPSDAENKNVSWRSSNANVATVNANGTVVASSVGNTTITVTTEDGSHTASCNVTVKEKPVNVTSITLDKNSFYLSFGDSETINATIKPDNATNKNVVWTSSDPTVAKVEGGVVTAMSKEGTVTITATSEDNRSLSATCSVKVVRRFVAVTGLKVEPSSLNIYLGQTKQLKATVSPSNATDTTVIWSVQQGGVVAVDQNGWVTPLKVDKYPARVFAKTQDGGFSKSVQVTVAKNDVGSIELPNSKIVLKVGETYDLTATVKGSDPLGFDASAPASNPNVTWKSDSTTIANVASFANGGADASKKTGRITARSAGTTTITVTSSDNSDVKATCEVTVLDGGSTGGGNEGVEFDDWNF